MRTRMPAATAACAQLKNEIAAASRKKPAALLKKLDDYGKVIIAGGQNGGFVDLG